jgi:hypothetical protein
MVYVADIPKVPRAEFEAVIKALLNTPPLPMAAIPCKRKLKAKERDREEEMERTPRGRTANRSGLGTGRSR